jgi:spore germination protein YaaH
MNRTFLVRIIPVILLLLSLAPFSAEAAARSLTLDMSGSDVTALQDALIKAGYLAAGKNTGYFGPLTDEALKKFQCAKNIICADATYEGYGIAGPKTMAALQVAIAPVQPATISGKMTPAATGAFEISGWVPDWRTASATADVLPHLNKMTSVMPFGYKVSASGKILDKDKYSKGEWPAFIAAAKAAKVRVVPSLVWGTGPEIHAVLSDTNARIALEDEVAKLVKDNNFDGIDIDFEAKQSQTINYFSTFLKGLYQRMGKKWVYCTIEARMPLEDRYLPGTPVPPDATEYANDFIEMNKYCDRVEVMAYDQGTVARRLNIARSAPYAPVADAGWVENLVTLAAQTISRNKLIIGIPTYGYEYEVTPVSSGFQYKQLWAFNPKYALDIAAKLGITPYRTSANELGFTYDADVLATLAPTGDSQTETQHSSTPTLNVTQNLGSQISGNKKFNYVTWSDATAMADKVELARRLGVRGVAVFSLGGAEDQGMWNILK